MACNIDEYVEFNILRYVNPWISDFFDFKYRKYSTTLVVEKVPFLMNEDVIHNAFSNFGPVTVSWAQKRLNEKRIVGGKVYVTFEHLECLNYLVCHSCSTSHIVRYVMWINDDDCVTVLLRPFKIYDAIYAEPNILANTNSHLAVLIFYESSTLLTAGEIAGVMKEKFGPVCYVGLSLDYSYFPKGSAMVIFYRQKDYIKAIRTVYTNYFYNDNSYTLEIRLFVFFNHRCDYCFQQFGFYRGSELFCLGCFKYFCVYCWEIIHQSFYNKFHRRFNLYKLNHVYKNPALLHQFSRSHNRQNELALEMRWLLLNAD